MVSLLVWTPAVGDLMGHPQSVKLSTIQGTGLGYTAGEPRLTCFLDTHHSQHGSTALSDAFLMMPVEALAARHTLACCRDALQSMKVQHAFAHYPIFSHSPIYFDCTQLA